MKRLGSFFGFGFSCVGLYEGVLVVSSGLSASDFSPFSWFSVKRGTYTVGIVNGFFDVKVVQKDCCLRVLIGAHVSIAEGGQTEQPHP